MKIRPSGILRSATKRAHSHWPMLLNVHEATSVSCLRIKSRLTSMEVAPPSPTKHMRPHVAALRTAATRRSGRPVQSMVASAPSPWVRSMMASPGRSRAS